MILTRSPLRGGCIIQSGELIACYSGNSGGRKAEAFFLHALYGRVPEAVKAADDSGISHKEITRALKLRRERAKGHGRAMIAAIDGQIEKARIGGGK